jgi:hypothetical protein
VLIEAIDRPRHEYNRIKQDQKEFVDENFSINSIVKRYTAMLHDVYQESRSPKGVMRQPHQEVKGRLASKG